MRMVRYVLLVGLAFGGVASAKVTRLGHWDRVPAAHTVLVAPDGQPVGGPWQQWVDESHAPTVNSDVTVEGGVSTACSSAAGACSTPDTIYVQRNVTRGMLYHELGHIFDADVLTDAERLRFMRIWRWRINPGETVQDAWWRGEADANPEFGHGPPAEWFAEGYRLCATFAHWTWDSAYVTNWYQYGYPAQLAWEVRVSKPRQTWALRQQQATCALIHAAA